MTSAARPACPRRSFSAFAPELPLRGGHAQESSLKDLYPSLKFFMAP